MNNLTNKIFLALLFLATSASLWANESPKEKGIPSFGKTTEITVAPAPPSVAYLRVERCGYEAPNDNRMLAVIEAKGCDNGFIQWYDVNNTNLGGSDIGNQKYLQVTSDIIVHATCTVSGQESSASQNLSIKYVSAPSVRPFITLDNNNKAVCEGEIITLKSSVTDPKYIYAWEKSTGISDTYTYPNIFNQEDGITGKGSPEIKTTKGAYYFLTIRSPDCPNVIVYGQGQVLADVFVVPKTTITASDTVFCEDKSVSLKIENTQGVERFEWYVNGTKQDSLGTTNIIKSFNKTANIQVSVVASYLGCKSQLSNPLYLRALKVPAKPVITPSKTGAAICQGDTLSLLSSTAFKYKWSNGATTPSIKNITTFGKYAVQVIDSSGCVSKPSDTTTVTIFKVPTKPVISADGPIAFCSGGSVNLTSTPSSTYLWSTKATTRSINVNTSGDVTVVVRDINNCLSPTSDPVKVIVYALPAKPTITASSSLSFCADQSVILTSSDLVNGEKTRYRWNTTDSTKSLTVKTSATFTVRVLDPRNCLSPASDPITTIALPLPPAPTVTADGALIFCARSNTDYTKANSVNLTATTQSKNEITWNTGLVSTTLSLTAIGADGKFVDISREYTATVKDATTGCISAKSIPLAIIVKNNPDISASSIDKDGTFTLKAVNFPDGTDYEWKFIGDAKPLTFTEGTIKANRYGDYTARRKAVFTVPAPTNTLACFSDFVKPYTFKEDPDFKGLSIYPNPSNGLLTIETLADYDNPEIIIYDLLGRLIYTGTVPSIKGKLIVDLRNQPEGEYMLRFKASGFDLAKRIIIDR